MSRIQLPPAPDTEAGPVKAWSQPVEILTYEPAAADRNPMFLEKRVYQGSSGRVYPLPFTDRIATEPRIRTWQALHLENEYIRVMVLPEIGGRIHIGLDKTNGYDFFYRQNVIKPALVGLAGPWISGGVEFNWPQHHRPATFMPVDWTIEEADDGARTILCSDHDPMTRMKGMHGVCLYPGRAYLEVKVRLYNRTPLVQTFLWWANAATHVDERYQSFFPPDVHFVADHAKRAVSEFPLCQGIYYGIDYASRARNGLPTDEMPRRFTPLGEYAGNDLSWYANIPVPTSYMATGSSGDFCGGYDHARETGLIHVANHHISPGKKQWTWGNQEFGYAWDRNLTDADGPYVELMAGVYTDNQPDFSFLAPGETKTFSQFWYPIQKMGPAHEANTEAALSLTIKAGSAHAALCTTRPLTGVRIELRRRGEKFWDWACDMAPGTPFYADVAVPPDAAADEFEMRAITSGDQELIRYRPVVWRGCASPGPATEPPAPHEIAYNDELYVTGLHLEQYRHATRSPEAYWQEALTRDPGDARCNHALGLWHLRRGEFDLGEQYIRRSIERLTLHNPNPYDGEPYYSLGLALRFSGRQDEAYAAFYKAIWDSRWRSAAYFALAEIGTARGALESALAHLRLCLRTNADHLQARDLQVMLIKKMGRQAEAEALLAETLALDPLDYWACALDGGSLGNQARLDVAFDMVRSGLLIEAKQLLESADLSRGNGSVPIILYTLGYISYRLGSLGEMQERFEQGAKARPDYCFPSRLCELLVLEAALKENHADARAHYYVGNWLYDRRRHEEAIEHWERSVALDPTNAIAWRNLGIAYFNISSDGVKADWAFERAVHAEPSDARLRYERDQLWKRVGVSPANRLSELKSCLELVRQRDDLTIELAALYNQTGQPAKAADVMEARRFQPWEGGEGAVLGQYVRAQLARGRVALESGDTVQARGLISAALEAPEQLGEAWHLLANRSHVYYWLGVACKSDHDTRAARHWWQKAAESAGDFQETSIRPYSEMTYYSALALRRLGQSNEARDLLRELLRYARTLARSKARINYFATSLPAMLLFNEDTQRRSTITALFLEGQAAIGLGFERRWRRLIDKVLEMDPSHPMASDLISELRTEANSAAHARTRVSI